eukprot:scaffold27201_cov62-Phaeocystis_antarctica.AAC.2
MGPSMRRMSCLAHMTLPATGALHRLEVDGVVVEDHHELGVKVILERVAVQDDVELLEQVQRLLGGVDRLEALVDEALQAAL